MLGNYLLVQDLEALQTGCCLNFLQLETQKVIQVPDIIMENGFLKSHAVINYTLTC